jgi:cation-transporting ATPase E
MRRGPGFGQGANVNFDVTSVDSNPPLLPQIRQWLLALIEAPYSALVSNVLLIILACVFVTTGSLVSWIATHPLQIQHVIMGWRRRSRVRQAERYLRQGLAFLLRRFDLAGAYGLSFTIALASLLLGVWFFGSVLEDLLAYNDTALLDAPVARFMALHRIAWLTKAMKAINLLGSGASVIIAALGTTVVLRYQAHGWRLPLFLLAVVAGAEILDLATGFLVARPRPPAAWMAVSASAYGFTPGQTTVSVFYGFVAYLIAERGATWRSKVFIWSGTILMVFLIGVSRVYLGTDWLTDVLSRWALALIWLAAALIVEEIVQQSSGATIALPTETASPEVTAPQAPPEPLSISEVRRPEVPIDGLTQSEVAERHSRGEVNVVKERTSRTVPDILKANIFTRFNALLGGLFAVILLLSGKQDALFGLILVGNTAVGVVQELRAKRTLDRLRVLVAPRAHVLRDGTLQDVPADQIVIDDVLELHPGDQVPVDGRLLAAQGLEVNESLLTGEADPISKSRGDQVLSGSFIVAGGGRLQAVQIGEASYARSLARAAQQFTLSRSQLRSGINNILRYVTWALIPTAVLLFVTQLLYSPAGVHDAAVSSIAGVVGMVPEGLVLLTSTVMAIALVRLAGYGALVQELAAVELLARVDVLCADKTGTLTEGASTLEEIIPASAADNRSPPSLPADVRNVLGAFAHGEASPTASSIALKRECPLPKGATWNIVASVPFSSTRKWSALTFASGGTWILGAPEIVLKNVDHAVQLLASVNEIAKRGKRVLALVSSKRPLDAEALALPHSCEPAALIVLGEKIRADVAETIRYFEEQGVAVKVISGDHAETVQAVAALAGVHSEQPAFDARNLPTEPTELANIVNQYSLFGRVTPAQKRLMVQTLHGHGHVVAMIGDGINDVLAIKEADFGIALGSGTAASRAVAQLILLRDNFSTLPTVIAEGRRVIANVERTANLFITKTVYVFALALAIVIAQAPFPFLPRHLTLVGFLTIGTPGLFLSFARNTAVARPGFVSRVLRFAFPAGAIAAAATLLGYAATRLIAPSDIGLARTAATLTLVGCGLLILWLLARPRGIWQWLALSALPALLFAIMMVPWARDFFALELPPLSVWGAIVLIDAISTVTLLVTARPRSNDDQRYRHQSLGSRRA